MPVSVPLTTQTLDPVIEEFALLLDKHTKISHLRYDLRKKKNLSSTLFAITRYVNDDDPIYSYIKNLIVWLEKYFTQIGSNGQNTLIKIADAGNHGNMKTHLHAFDILPNKSKKMIFSYVGFIEYSVLAAVILKNPDAFNLLFFIINKLDGKEIGEIFFKQRFCNRTLLYLALVESPELLVPLLGEMRRLQNPELVVELLTECDLCDRNILMTAAIKEPALVKPILDQMKHFTPEQKAAILLQEDSEGKTAFDLIKGKQLDGNPHPAIQWIRDAIDTMYKPSVQLPLITGPSSSSMPASSSSVVSSPGFFAREIMDSDHLIAQFTSQTQLEGWVLDGADITLTLTKDEASVTFFKLAGIAGLDFNASISEDEFIVRCGVKSVSELLLQLPLVKPIEEEIAHQDRPELEIG